MCMLHFTPTSLYLLYWVKVEHIACFIRQVSWWAFSEIITDVCACVWERLVLRVHMGFSSQTLGLGRNRKKHHVFLPPLTVSWSLISSLSQLVVIRHTASYRHITDLCLCVWKKKTDILVVLCFLSCSMTKPFTLHAICHLICFL